jgi:hypothetical protein
MDTGKVYFDSEGNECSIWQMVKREPTWAAVRIQEGEKAIDEITTLRQQLADVTGCACNSEGPCKYHAMTSVSGRSYVLRQQADELEK